MAGNDSLQLPTSVSIPRQAVFVAVLAEKKFLKKQSRLPGSSASKATHIAQEIEGLLPAGALQGERMQVLTESVARGSGFSFLPDLREKMLYRRHPFEHGTFLEVTAFHWNVGNYVKRKVNKALVQLGASSISWEGGLAASWDVTASHPPRKTLTDTPPGVPWLDADSESWRALVSARLHDYAMEGSFSFDYTDDYGVNTASVAALAEMFKWSREEDGGPDIASALYPPFNFHVRVSFFANEHVQRHVSNTLAGRWSRAHTISLLDELKLSRFTGVFVSNNCFGKKLFAITDAELAGRYGMTDDRSRKILLRTLAELGSPATQAMVQRIEEGALWITHHEQELLSNPDAHEDRAASNAFRRSRNMTPANAQSPKIRAKMTPGAAASRAAILAVTRGTAAAAPAPAAAAAAAAAETASAASGATETRSAATTATGSASSTPASATAPASAAAAAPPAAAAPAATAKAPPAVSGAASRPSAMSVAESERTTVAARHDGTSIAGAGEEKKGAPEGRDAPPQSVNVVEEVDEEQAAEEEERLEQQRASMKTEPIDDSPFSFLFLGCGNVGKTSLAKVWMGRDFDPNEQTTANSVQLEHNLGRVHLECWDTSGQRLYRDMALLNARQADIVVLMYDVTNRQSFEEVEELYDTVERNGLSSTCITCMIGNKCDLDEQRQVSLLEGIELSAKLQQSHFFETSARTGAGVQSTLNNMLLAAVRERAKNRETTRRSIVIGGRGDDSPALSDNSGRSSGQKSGCCS